MVSGSDARRCSVSQQPENVAETPPFDLYAFVRQLFPIARSLTGNGVRETLSAVAAFIPLKIVEVASGTPVLDWEVPEEWNIRAATIRSLSGEILVDFADNNLHVMGYSQSVRGVFSHELLAAHVHTLPQQPGTIPYRTGYYARDWGFCLAHDVWSAMRDEAYYVEIDATLAPGALTYGEAFLPGTSDGEILISVHVCHPSLANDNLTGIALATALANRASRLPERRLGLRFLFLPATIGAITWLAQNEHHLGRIRHGLVLTCLGDEGPFHYKRSRSGAPVDRAVEHVLREAGHPFATLPFSPYGYDERQYSSPGFDLPVGCLMRSVHGTFPEYHTSLDNLDFVQPNALVASFGVLCAILDLLDADRTYRRVDGRGEPQLGRRGLYRAIAGQKEAGGASQVDLLWFLNLADGRHGLLDIAERANVPFHRIAAAAALAREAHLVQEVL